MHAHMLISLCTHAHVYMHAHMQHSFSLFLHLHTHVYAFMCISHKHVSLLPELIYLLTFCSCSYDLSNCPQHHTVVPVLLSCQPTVSPERGRLSVSTPLLLSLSPGGYRDWHVLLQMLTD